MNNILPINYDSKPAYNIHIEPDFVKLPGILKTLGMKNRRFMIVTESNVGKYYLEDVVRLITPIAACVHTYTFRAGEASKNLDTVSLCYEKLITAGFDRQDILVALGGGVVGDLTGFTAATYLRGIRFIQLPTSLLSMVDSSIGGKTGVDFKAYKNMVGAFHQPSLVYMNISALNTLPDTQYFSGMGEIIKHGLIKDAVFYSWLKDNRDGIARREYEILREMIYRSCRIKKPVVEEDPKEKGDRALLNFGHTIGHSVEKLMNFSLLHGECVCIGMAAASYIAMKRGNIMPSEYEDILNTIKLFNEPVGIKRVNNSTLDSNVKENCLHLSGISGEITAEDIYEVTKSDKKMDSDIIKFILLQGIGNSVIDRTVTKAEMLEAIHIILQ